MIMDLFCTSTDDIIRQLNFTIINIKNFEHSFLAFNLSESTLQLDTPITQELLISTIYYLG